MTAPVAQIRRQHHVFWLLAGLAVLLVAALGQQGAGETVRFAGWALPPTCQLKLATGVPCAGCGLTRSFVALADGDVRHAWQQNWLGPPLFALLLASTLWRTLVLVRPATEQRWGHLARPGWWVFAGLFAVAVVLWAIRLIGQVL